MTYKIEDYIKAQQAVQQAQEAAQIAEGNAIAMQTTFNQAQASFGNDPDRIKPIFERAKAASADAKMAGIAAKKKADSVGNQATRANLEEMLDGMKLSEMKGLIDTYTPSFDDKGKFKGPDASYEEAAKLHAESRSIENMLEYAIGGENNSKKNQVLDGMAEGIVEEMIRNNPKKYLKIDASDPDYDLLVDAALEYDYADPRVLRADFENAAPDAIEKRKKDLYGKVKSNNNLSKADLKGYITGSIADADLENVFNGYANAYIKAQKAAQSP